MSSPELRLDSSPSLAPAEYSLENLGNTELPIYARKQELIDAMQDNQVVIIISPTGSGKSTQVPQYAMEAGFAPIRMTQPRRRASHNVSDRVISELSATLGDDVGTELVSCQTGGGLMGRYDAHTQIMTEAVLDMRDTSNTMGGDNELWVLDEVHEGSNDMWLLKGFAKEKLAANPNFTVVVMTATMNKFEEIDFWTNRFGVEPAVVELEGGTNYDIEYREEPLSTTAREAIKAAIDIFENPDAHDGANTIQVFEAGKREIKDTIDEIRRGLPAEVLAKARLLENHAKMTKEAQQPVYEDFDGIKIVVQTNIGKTSMTIPRTRYVIASGQERMPELSDEDVSALRRTPSSQDCLTQMMGRAGRTSTGIYILTKHYGQDYVPVDERAAHLQPEILRSVIDRVVMRLALRGRNIRDFDSSPRPPDAVINRSVHRLQLLGVLDDREQITNLGRRMGKYPASPEHQRCLVEAEKYSEQVRLAMAAMVASAEVGGLRLFEPGSPSWERLTDERTSDLFAQLEMFISIKRKRVNEMAQEDLDRNNIIRADELYRKIARRAGINDIPPLKAPSVQNRRILHECIIRGYANSAFLPQGEGMYRAIGGLVRARSISNRSVVPKNTRNAVVGRPFDIEIEKNGVLERKPLLEQVTEVPIRELGKYVTGLTTWRPSGFRLRSGKFVQLQEQVLGDRVLEVREVRAEPSPVLRAAVIDQVRARPGKNLIELYKIKRELEQLARRTKRPIPLLTNDAINNLIAEAAPDDVTSPGHVESNLRQIIADRQITLDAYLTPEQRAKILADSPDQITVEGYDLQLRYSRGKPIAKRCTVEMLEGFEDEPTLADGRPIFFSYGGKNYTLPQLRKHLRFLGEL
ncbi:MAG TPA: helicase-related protein [Candidatus Microsaccharimonas sp.]|nr:helicase-related protein [Candidatus Microsaccharimonas sp.]